MNSPFRAVTTPKKARLRVEDFLLLNDSGAFGNYSKTELIEGEIYFLNAQHSRHARIKTQLAIELAICLREQGSELQPIVEASTQVSDESLPEPDIVVTSYKGPHVVPLETVALLIEVSDTTLKTDLGKKAKLYATNGVPEYWVVDTEACQIYVFWSPAADGFARERKVGLGERIEAVTIAGLIADTAGLV